MRLSTVLKIGVIASALALELEGLHLTSEYGPDSNYSSNVPTATQTVAICHNSCSYLAPDIAAHFHLGMILAAACFVLILGVGVWARIENG